MTSPAPDAPARSSITRRRSTWERAAWILVRTPAVLVMSPSAAVGGQAVMDGVMMRGPHSWAVAVRRHDGSIAVQHREVTSFASRHPWARLPVIRGVVALFEALIIGMKALFVSSEYAIEGVEAKYAEEEGELDPAAEVAELHEVERAASMSNATSAVPVPVPLPHHEDHPQPDPDKLGTMAIVVAMIVAMGFSIGLFKVVPVTLSTFIFPAGERDGWAFVLVEALIKFAIFCVYLLIVGLMADMKRVFQYHSAEHKAINAFERGVPLEPKAVNEMSRIHVRCGTAFIVWLFLVGLIVFRIAQVTFLEGANRWEIIGARPLLLPIIAGLSFELLRFAGKHADNGALRIVLAPGLWFQRLTTRECTPEQCEVAIRSLEEVVAFEKSMADDPEHADETGDEYQVLA